jgi:hypothetical protein
MIAASRSGRVLAAAAAGGVALVVLAAAAGATPAEKLLVLPASGKNVSASIVVRARAHLVELLGAPGRFQVVDQDGPPTTMPPDAAEAVAQAVAAGADIGVTFHVVHDGDETVLVLAGYPVRGGGRMLDHREPVSGGPENLPAAIARMVGTLAPGGGASTAAAAAPAGPPAVVARSSPLPPQPSFQKTVFLGARLGPAVLLDTAGGDDARWLPWASFFLVRITASSLIELFLDYGTQKDASLKGVGGGFYLPLSRGGGSGFYAGGAVRYLWIRLGGVGGDGVSVEPVLGYLFAPGRSSPSMRIEAGYVRNLFQEHSADRLIPGAGAGYTSHGPLLTLGMAL